MVASTLEGARIGIAAWVAVKSLRNCVWTRSLLSMIPNDWLRGGLAMLVCADALPTTAT